MDQPEKYRLTEKNTRDNSFKVRVTFIFLVLVVLLASSCSGDGSKMGQARHSSHPCLLFSPNSLSEIRSGVKTLPILKEAYSRIKVLADSAIKEGILVPLPTDPGGGYTHEQHKKNAYSMYYAGLSYQLSEENEYAEFVRDMLFAYADLYPGLGLHPQRKDQAPGKLFWQGLNESVWLVYSIMAYDCIYDFLDAADKERIENNLFRNIVKFFTTEDPYSFNSIHNHGTWAVAGVGMTGIVLNEPEYLQMALKGTDLSGSSGFLEQINQLFSPDGYYAEGPYYQRYAMMPFILFARALDINYPEEKIFEFKDSVLLKSVETLLQLSSLSGNFFPLNDAIKDKDLHSPEVIFATDIAYAKTGDPRLLSIAKEQGNVLIGSDGLATAEAIEKGLARSFDRHSLLIRDGADGSAGGLAILRGSFGKNNLELLLKASSQGMGHGHFDRLSIVLYENGKEVLSDYGSARFLNIEEKHGGRYLPENQTWAKQTIAHNTVSINGKSQFNLDVSEAERYHPYIKLAELDRADIRIVAATDSNSYEGVVLHRVLALINHQNRPYIVDLFRVKSKVAVTTDLAWHYTGQLLDANFDIHPALQEMSALDKQNGYQHLWLKGNGDPDGKQAVLSWLSANRIYHLYSEVNAESEILLTETGAGDPEFNLRNEPGIIQRQKQVTDYSYLTLIEPHGNIDPVNESVSEGSSRVETVNLVACTDDAWLVHIAFRDGTSGDLAISIANDSVNSITTAEGTVDWSGSIMWQTK